MLTLSSLVPPALGAPSEERFYVVGFPEVPQSVTAGGTLHGAEVERVDKVLDFARVSTHNPNDFLARARDDHRVRFVEPDPEIDLLQAVPNDPGYVNQYGPQQVRAPEAWTTTFGDLDASVCVVDTGVRYTHEDIAGARWLGGHDFHNGDSNPMDDNGHGTHVAGTAAATLNNGIGIAGMANVGVYGVKVLSESGSGAWSTVASGISWCADNAGPRTVINLSLGGGGGATVLQSAVTYAYSKGALLVAAAGNGGPCNNCVIYPAAYPEVIAVTCTTSSETQCGFSSDGPQSELAAPGQSILSLWHTSNTAYNTISGTSMSTPHAAGAAALAWSAATTLTNQDLRAHLRGSAKDLGPAGWDEQFGYGLVDANVLLDAALAPPPPESSLFFEDFDDGSADGWTLGGLWHVSSACATAPSAPNYLAFNQDSDCEYSTGARVRGHATFSVDLTGRSSASLEFLHRFEKDNSRDEIRVQVSTNGGSSFTTLKQWGSYNADQLDWLAHTIDLTPYSGQTIKLRFFFDSFDGTANNFEGWFLDDVEVTGSVGELPNQPPVASAGADQTVADDDATSTESVLLDGSASSDVDGTITSYEWRDAAGAIVGSEATTTMDLPVGNHTFTLTVTDNEGEAASDDVVITVTPNATATASFTYVTDGTTVSVDGSSSTDPDGSIASYSWDWGDETLQDSGVVASHTFASLGSYVITLTVVDNGNASASTSKTVALGEAPTLFFEDFDDGSADGWTLGGLWHVSSACATAPSAPNYLAFNQDSDCEYSTGARVRAHATFSVDLTGRSSASLEFLHRFEKDNSRDEIRVQVSTNGGSSFTTLKQWGSYNADQLDWLAHTIDLTPYAGQAIKLRFFFDSFDGGANNFEGWFLDDVEVTGS